MELYSIKGNKLNNVRLNPFKKEREIQDLVEENTETLFDVDFVSSEFKIGEFRIDTLCFDNETNSFVIIEYKKGSSYSVIDQGYSYLSKMLNNKDSFILEYCRKKKVSVDIEVDWSQSRIIFVSPSFNSYQKNSVNFKDMNKFELWEIKRFDNDTIVLNQHQSNSNESIEKVIGNTNSIINKVNKEVKDYSEEEKVNILNEDIRDIYLKLKDKILELDDVDIVCKKHYVGFRTNKTIFVSINFFKTSLTLTFVRGNIRLDGTKSQGFFSFDDPKKICKVSKFKQKGTLGREYYKGKLSQIDEIDYYMLLIKQKYNSL